MRSKASSVSWLAPTIAYVLAVGALGVTSKRALETLSWQQLLPWTLLAYAVTAGILLALGQTDWRWHPGTAWALASASLAVGSLILLFVALGLGEASKVVPVSAAYPAATVVLAALFLGEHVSPARVIGMLLIIGGVVLLTVAR
jgi:bacterial/archaeal transporter family protein